MMTASLNEYVIISSLLFVIGFFGVLLRRNTLVVFMCLDRVDLGARRVLPLQCHDGRQYFCLLHFDRGGG